MNSFFLIFLAIPALEIFLMIKIGGKIGALSTISLVFFTAVIGVYFAKIEGIKTIRSGFSNLYQNLISPYYICLLLWYPAFENLFSILRRKFVKRGFSTYADNEHIHHFLFKLLNKNIRIKKLSNSLSGIIINLFNFSFIYIGSNFINNTKILSLIIIFSVCFYLLIYFILKKITINKNEFSS